MGQERIKYLEENCGYDYIVEIVEGKDFTQVVSSMGGDYHTHRIYGDSEETFEIYER